MTDEDKTPWPRWSVTSGGGGINRKTRVPTERTHTLKYNNAAVNSAKGVSGLNAMIEQAKFCNERKLKPNPEKQCLADMSDGARKAEAMKWSGILAGGEPAQ